MSVKRAVRILVLLVIFGYLDPGLTLRGILVEVLRLGIIKGSSYAVIFLADNELRACILKNGYPNGKIPS